MPTPSPTPSANLCGNGVLDAGEECDDGNLLDDDGCSSTCTSELIPGSAYGFGRRECFHEWLVPPFEARLGQRLPSVNVYCTDDDPQCDYGAVSGDAACTFHVAMCFNVADMRRVDPATAGPYCSGTDLQRVYLMTRLRFADQMAPDVIDAANRDALESALAGIGAAVRGQCVRDDTSELRTLCTSDDECDTDPSDGDAHCRGRFMAFDPPLTGSRCTSFADIVVPLARTTGVPARGEKWIRLRATPIDDPASGERQPGDTDILRLYCEPPR